MKITRPKIIFSFLLISLLFCLSGCLLTSKVSEKAEGNTWQRIDPSQIKKGDKVGVIDAGAGACYVIQYPKDKDNSKKKMPVIPPYHDFYICKPKPAYYALVPLTIPTDIVIFPYTAYLIVTTPPVSH